MAEDYSPVISDLSLPGVGILYLCTRTTSTEIVVKEHLRLPRQVCCNALLSIFPVPRIFFSYLQITSWTTATLRRSRPWLQRTMQGRNSRFQLLFPQCTIHPHRHTSLQYCEILRAGCGLPIGRMISMKKSMATWSMVSRSTLRGRQACGNNV